MLPTVAKFSFFDQNFNFSSLEIQKISHKVILPTSLAQPVLGVGDDPTFFNQLVEVNKATSNCNGVPGLVVSADPVDNIPDTFDVMLKTDNDPSFACGYLLKSEMTIVRNTLKKNFLKKIFGYEARCEFWVKIRMRFWILVGYVDFLAKFGAKLSFRV